MPRIAEDRFRLLVLTSLDGIPAWAHDALECVDVTIDDEPPASEPTETMGLFDGVPLPEREPDSKGEDIAVTVAGVVRHELAHYFGIDGEELLDLGAY